eukprot:Sdes_comp19185_c0_seq3m9999
MEEIFRLFLVYNCFLFVFLLHQWFVSSSFFLFFSFFFYIMDSAELPEWMSQEHMTGTTIMAVEYKGGVVIGADSRTTTGAYIANRVTDKLTYINDRIYCCRSGSAADTQAIASYVQYYLNMHALVLVSFLFCFHISVSMVSTRSSTLSSLLFCLQNRSWLPPSR